MVDTLYTKKVGGDRLISYSYKKLKELRQTNGLTLEQMGKRLGKTKQQLSLWECGVNSPNTENLALICNTFGVGVSFFFDNTSTCVDDKTTPESRKKI